MRKCLPPLLAFWTVAVLPTVAHCQAKAPKDDAAPSLIIHIRSIDGLMEDAKYIMTMAGQEELAKQMDGMLKSMVGKEGLKGIDTKRPMGFYGTVGKNLVDSTGVALIPVADEKAFIELLDGMNLNVKKGEEGVYSFTPPNSPVDAYFRFANKYAYVAPSSKDPIAPDKLLAPASVLAEKSAGAFSISIRFDRIPTEVKQILAQQMELRLNNELEKKQEGETEVQHKFRAAMLKDLAERVNRVFSEGRTLTFQLNLDRKTDELFIDLSLSGLKGSQLAANIAELGKAKSLFGAALGTDSAMNMLVNVALPADAQKLWAQVIEEAIKQALEKEKDKEKREQAEIFVKALAPSLKTGDLDAAFSIRGPSKDDKFTFLIAVKVKDGDRIDKAARKMVKHLKKEEQEKITFDAYKVDSTPIHKLDIKKDLDEKSKRLFGDSPLYVGVRPDAWYFAFGEGGLEAVKQAVAAAPQTAPQMQFEMMLKRFAPAMAETEKGAVQAAEAAFGKGSGSDRIRFVIEGGRALQMRFSMKAPVIKFFAELARTKLAEKQE